MAIDYLRETPELRKLSQRLVADCLANNQISINHSLDLIKKFVTRKLVRNFVPHYTILLIFHASFKALILNNREIDLNRFFESFKEILPSNLSALTCLFNKMSKISEIIYETIDDEELLSHVKEEEMLLKYEVDSLVEILSPSRLLWLAGLSKKFEKETLDFIWSIYSINLSDRNVLNELLEVAFIRNNIEILKWCQDKFNNNEFIEKMYNSWMSGRDWGKGPYIKFLREEKIKLVFALPEAEESQYGAILTWIEENTETSNLDEVEFKRRELIFDLAVRTRKKDDWLKPLCNLLSYNQEKVKESYAYSRFAAEAVIKRDLGSLNEFLDEVSQREDTLKIAIQKRLLVDSTWAFHEAVRSGKKDLIDFFLLLYRLKIQELPVFYS